MSSTPDPQSAPTSRETRSSDHVLILPDRQISYTAIAGWQTLYEKDKPVAEMFHVAYLAENTTPTHRPITFVFNGGPGAASAFLHMGALGPSRVVFGEKGSLPKPPVRLVDNHESWLSFSDLVFIDPIGTGFSRTLPPDPKNPSGSQSKGGAQASDSGENPAAEPPDADKEKVFWEMARDLKSLGEFMQRFLSQYHRWLSPTFIAGESYGGFRVAKLCRSLQEEFGIGLSGAILISPALEFSLLYGSDYTLSYWASLIPSFAVAAAHQGRARWGGAEGDLSAHRAAAERFTRRSYLAYLALGQGMPEAEQQEILQELAGLIGLPVELVRRHGGRIDRQVFSRELLRDERKVVGLYDASITAIDPFPDRAQFEGSDPTLAGFERLFTGAINSHLRESLGIETDLIYSLLNFDVFKAWKFKLDQEFKQGYVGAVDELRVGMTLNPFMQVLITHGLFDLVTTYFATDHLVGLMKLEPEIRANLTLSTHLGGHMFYTWDSSRQQWFDQMHRFYQQATSESRGTQSNGAT